MSTQEKIQQLQMIEGSLQSLLGQKQNFQLRLSEIESAINELAGQQSAYKIVGNIMVQANAADLKTELESQKEMLKLRIKTLETQEQGIRQKAQALQKEVLGELKENKNE